MLDPAAEQIEVRRLVGDSYARPVVVGRDAHVESVVLPDFVCPVSTLFPW